MTEITEVKYILAGALEAGESPTIFRRCEGCGEMYNIQVPFAGDDAAVYIDCDVVAAGDRQYVDIAFFPAGLENNCGECCIFSISPHYEASVGYIISAREILDTEAGKIRSMRCSRRVPCGNCSMKSTPNVKFIR